MSAVDAELRGHIKTLEALATSDDLERNDLKAFHAEATRVLAAQPDWSQVILSDAQGRQLLNTRLPFGSPLAGNVENTSWQIGTARIGVHYFHIAVFSLLAVDVAFHLWPRLMTTYGGF